MLNQHLNNGFDVTNENPVFYKSVDSNNKDFYIVHVYTPEHFTLLRYINVAGVVTTHYSTVSNKHELHEMVISSMRDYKKLRLIDRNEYMAFKNIYDNYAKSVHV